MASRNRFIGMLVGMTAGLAIAVPAALGQEPERPESPDDRRPPPRRSEGPEHIDSEKGWPDQRRPREPGQGRFRQGRGERGREMMGRRGFDGRGMGGPGMRGRGRPDRGMREQLLPPKECQKFMDDHYPDKKVMERIGPMMTSRGGGPERYVEQRLWPMLSDWATRWKTEKNRDAVTTEMGVHALRLRLHELSRQYRQASDDDAQLEQIEAKIRERCDTLFEKELKLKQLELKRVQERIDRLRKKLEERRAKKDFWVEELVQEQIDDMFFSRMGDLGEGPRDEMGRDGNRDLRMHGGAPERPGPPRGRPHPPQGRDE